MGIILLINWQGVTTVDGYVPDARWYDYYTVSPSIHSNTVETADE